MQMTVSRKLLIFTHWCQMAGLMLIIDSMFSNAQIVDIVLSLARNEQLDLNLMNRWHGHTKEMRC